MNEYYHDDRPEAGLEGDTALKAVSEPDTSADETDEIDDKNTSSGRTERRNFYSNFFDWADSLVVTVFCIVLIFTFIIRLVGVDGSSMRETLHDQDRLFISGLFYTPSVGDIVVVSRDYLVLDSQHRTSNKPIIKRVVAVAGQQVDIREEQNGEYALYIDGVKQQEDYIREPMRKYYTKTVEFPYTVSDGCVFVMGDNRNDSHDSRAYDVGEIDNRYILGRVVLRVFPFDKIGDPDNE